jgi:hypothetical protein
MPFDYTSGNPDNLVGGLPAQMQDIQGPFYDLRAYLNSLTPGGGGGGGGAGLVVSSPVVRVGQVNQCRAGRQLALSDFTNLGLSAPRGLWNLSDLTDASGNARALTNKGGVAFAPGVNGAVTTRRSSPARPARRSTSLTPARPTRSASPPARGDAGSARPSAARCRTCSPSYRQASGATSACVVSRSRCSTNVATVGDGARSTATGVTDVADDRWHFAWPFDGSVLRLYVDGVLESDEPALSRRAVRAWRAR